MTRILHVERNQFVASAYKSANERGIQYDEDFDWGNDAHAGVLRLLEIFPDQTFEVV